MPDLSVLFVTRKWGPRVGGMETWSVRTAEHLGAVVDVDVLALPSRDQERAATAGQLARFGLQALATVAATPLPDVVHVGDLALWPIAAIASLRRPTFVTVHGSDVAFAGIDSPAGQAYRRYLAAARPLLSRVRLLPNSRATTDQLARHGLTCETPMYLGVDASLPADHEHTPDAEPAFVLFTGRLMERKGLAWFVESVLDRLDGVELWVAGALWDPTEASALDHDRVRFLGPTDRERLRELRRWAVAVVVPNRATVSPGATAFEGFGLVAVEAAGDGGVVVASDVYGLRDAVLDGTTGFRVPADDADAWADQLQRIRSWDPAERAQFVDRSVAAVQVQFSWPRYVGELVTAYRTAMAGGSPG